MSTCLFPLTTDDAKLERLCGVPPGTAARLRALEDEQAAREAKIVPRCAGEPPDYRDRCSSREENFYPALEAEPDVDNYSNFLLFGWGRVQNATFDALGLTDEVIGPEGEGALDDGRTDGSVHGGDCADRARCLAALQAQARHSNRPAWATGPRAPAGNGYPGGLEAVLDLAEGLRWG